LEQSPSEANNFSAGQDIPRNLGQPMIRYRVHNRMPLVPVFSHIIPVHSPIFFFKVSFNIILPFTPKSS
jgi:hypothetical protein